MPRRLLPSIGTAALLAVATPVAAQDRGATDDSTTIVVKGRRQSDVKQAERFVKQSVDLSTGPLPRFLEPVCIEILGVPSAKASAIVDRMRRVSAEAKVPLAPPGCEPNLIGAIVGDADGFIKMMRKKHGAFFEDLADVDVREALRPGKVHSWRLVEDRDVDGAPIYDMAEARTSSVFELSRQAATVNAVVVLDKSIVLNKTIAQLADYIVMRAIAGARPPKDGRSAMTSILTLFDDGAVAPKELTAMDEGLLSGLYASDGARDSMHQLHQISRGIAGGKDGRR